MPFVAPKPGPVTVIGVPESVVARWGLTVPLTGLSLPDHGDLVRELPAWGFTDLWSSEVAGTDAFTPLALASTWTGRLRLGTAIASVYTRGPALLAMSAAALAEAAPDASSSVSVRPARPWSSRGTGWRTRVPTSTPATCCGWCGRRWPGNGSTTPARRCGWTGSAWNARRSRRRRSCSPRCARRCCAWPVGKPTAPS